MYAGPRAYYELDKQLTNYIYTCINKPYIGADVCRVQTVDKVPETHIINTPLHSQEQQQDVIGRKRVTWCT